MKFAVIALLAPLLLAGSAASAKPLTRPEPSFGCSAFDSEATALACDPAGGRRRITMTLGALRKSAPGRGGIASIGSGEPLSPGETATVDWAHPSRDAELIVHVASPIGAREVVIVPDWRPTHIEVTALANGGAEVRTAARTVTLPPPTPLPGAAVWQVRSARQAALTLVKSMDRLERSVGVWRTLCAALDPYVGASMGIPIGIPPLGGLDDEDPCLVGIGIRVFGDENVPTVISTRHRGLGVRVHGDRAVFSTTLTHRYRTEEGKRRKLVTHARALLVKDSAGIWRLGGIESLFPLYAITHPRPFSDRELARIYAHNHRRGVRAQDKFQRQYAARVQATVQAGTTPPCSPTYVSDKPGDVVWNEGITLSRHQADHQDVDLLAAAAGGSCIAVRAAAPLPAKFTVATDTSDVTIDVNQRSVLVQDESNSDQGGNPISGVTASLVGNELVVHMPATLQGERLLFLFSATGGEIYGDSHRFG
ncbi:MAG TPA: hypothetical protein VH256_07905 [Thermoleophilaceae bacterium]|nr:hypothetical protein [Thermoleophilaceae bacterium]